MEAVINSDNRDAWQALADSLSGQFPSVGKDVAVYEGKHLGKSGVVKWHGRNRYYSTRYKTPAQLHLMDMRGREGFCVQVETETGEKFFVPAEYVQVQIKIEE